MIKEHQDLWDKLLEHPLCLTMGTLRPWWKAPNTMVLWIYDWFLFWLWSTVIHQDRLYLRSFVRYKLWVFAQATDWEDTKQAPVVIKKNKHPDRPWRYIDAERHAIEQDLFRWVSSRSSFACIHSQWLHWRACFNAPQCHCYLLSLRFVLEFKSSVCRVTTKLLWSSISIANNYPKAQSCPTLVNLPPNDIVVSIDCRVLEPLSYETFRQFF